MSKNDLTETPVDDPKGSMSNKMNPRLHTTITRLVILPAMAAIFGCSQTRPGLTLVNDGQSDYTIVTAPESSPPQRYAAEELSTFVKQISGASLPISETPVDGPMVLVGPSDALETVSPNIDYDALGADGLVMKTVGSHLVLTGGQPRGTLYAVYELLDGELGCRWFASGDVLYRSDGASISIDKTAAVSRIPKRKTIIVGPLEKTKIPALKYRAAPYREAWDGDWAARNRLNSHHVGVTEKHGGKIRYYIRQAWHTFKVFIGPGEIESNPELFALVGDERKTTQLCTMNPEVLQRATGVIRHWINDDPSAKFVAVVANDGGGFCSCELCGPLTEYEGTRAAPVLHLANQVADNIKDDYPHVMIDTLAYSPTVPTPRFVRPRDNVMVRFCPAQACRAHPLAVDCGDSGQNANQLAQWAEMCPQLYVYDYVVNFTNFLQPFPNFHTLQPNIQFYIKNKVKGIFSQGPAGADAEFTALRAYLMARVLWDPDCDFDAEMSDFLQAYYGPAGEPIGRYIQMMRENVESGVQPLEPLATDVLCPVSGKPMFKRQGSSRLILACENHPKCTGVLKIDSQGSRVMLPSRPPLQTNVPCPDCGELLALRRSFHFGPWLSCPQYPDCLGRIGWSKLEESKQTELEAALAAHEKAHPQMTVRTTDGKEYEANGEPLNIPGRPEGSNPWIQVHMFDSRDQPYLSKEIMDQAVELFDQAEAAVADDPVLLKRVRKERRGVDQLAKS